MTSFKVYSITVKVIHLSNSAKLEVKKPLGGPYCVGEFQTYMER